MLSARVLVLVVDGAWGSNLIGFSPGSIEGNYEQNLDYQLSLVVIVVYIFAVNRVPFARSMLSSKTEAWIHPKVYTNPS